MEHTVSPLLRLLDKDEDPSFDAFLYIGEKLVLKAHKSILGLSVPFFEKSFRSGMKEAETGEVKFPEKKVSKDTLRTLVRSVYGEKLVINETNVIDIHATANFMEMDEVSDKCVEFMLENLKVDTVLPLWEYSLTDFAGSKKMLKGCEEFIAGHFLDLYKNEFLNLGVDFMCAFLSQDSLCVSSENDVFDAMLCWLDHDWGNRFHLINERSLLDLVRWESIDLSVHKLSSLQYMRDHGHNSVEENVAVLMIYEKVIGLPERAKQPLTRVCVKRELTLCVPIISVLSEVGSLYCLKGSGRNIKVHVCDLATEQFGEPQPLNMPEGANHVVGMISHDSRPFVVVSREPVNKDEQCVLLLDLQQGRIKSKVDLVLPKDLLHLVGYSYLMAAAPPNADKLCIGFQRGTSCWLAVYDLILHSLDGPSSKGPAGRLSHSQFFAGPPPGTGARNIKIAYTLDQIWAVVHYPNSPGLEVFSYDLRSKSWSKPFVLASGAEAGSWMSDIAVISEYIAVPVFSYSISSNKELLKNQCWVHMFKCNDPNNATSRCVLQCSYAGEAKKYSIDSVSIASMGRRLVVSLHCRHVVNINKQIGYAFSTVVDKDGKPVESLSREESMDSLKPTFTLLIQ